MWNFNASKHYFLKRELYHYNHNHDSLGRFARNPGGSSASVKTHKKPAWESDREEELHELAETEAHETRKLAKRYEPKITKDISTIVEKNGCQMYGLSHRLKTEESMIRKIYSNKAINDALRYTAILSDNNFVKEYGKIKTDLNKKGYEEIRCKNYFEEYKKGKASHKSVQCNYKSNDGYIFEIQFQTKASQNAKNKKIPLYEEARNPNTSTERRGELAVQMCLLADKVKDPYGISKIRTYANEDEIRKSNYKFMQY